MSATESASETLAGKRNRPEVQLYRPGITRLRDKPVGNQSTNQNTANSDRPIRSTKKIEREQNREQSEKGQEKHKKQNRKNKEHIKEQRTASPRASPIRRDDSRNDRKSSRNVPEKK